MTDKAQAPQIRPSRIVAAAVRVMVASGYEIELKPDGTLIARPVSTQSPKAKVAPAKEIVL